MRKIIISITLLLMVLVMFKFRILFTLNYFDKIRNTDEYIIKEHRYHQNYSLKELKRLEIIYKGEMAEYRIYFVPYKDSSIPKEYKNKLYSSPKSNKRIVGIKNNRVYTYADLASDSSVYTRTLYKLLNGYY